jgi:hypothetical protein
MALAGAYVSRWWVQRDAPPPYNVPMVTRALMLAMVLAITLAVATLVLGDHGAGSLLVVGGLLIRKSVAR